MDTEIEFDALEHAYVSVFDSGMGGLSILRELMKVLPEERLYYFADNAHLPYGPRELDEVRRFSVAIAEQLMLLPSKVVVVACNTASAAALHELRRLFPGVLFVGMEPAVKPAVRESRSGRVGVLATQATFQGKLFESVVERFAHNVVVLRQPCAGLAEFIEMHEPDHPVLETMLRRYVEPLLEQGVDTLVLACTHYALVKDAIQKVAGENVVVIDPSPAIARRTVQVLEEAGLLAGAGHGGLTISVSGEAENFSRAASVHLGREVVAGSAPFCWVPSNESGE